MLSAPVIFFDGVCNLCNSAVQFVIKHDKEGVFRFAALQSEAGKSAKVRAGAESAERASQSSDSIILFYEGKYYIKSDAALKIARLLGGWLLLLMPGYLLPRFIRNAIYDVVAKRRYKWFGRKAECMIPTPELKARFLED